MASAVDHEVFTGYSSPNAPVVLGNLSRDEKVTTSTAESQRSSSPEPDSSHRHMPSETEGIYGLPGHYSPQNVTSSLPYSSAEYGAPESPRHRHKSISRNRRGRHQPGCIFSVDYPLPSAIRNAVQARYRDAEHYLGEFTALRYTAVTDDPNDFTLKNGYDLRPRMHNRHTENLICVTYYNEDKALLSRTLHSLFTNIRDIVNQKKGFRDEGGPSWQKLVICVIMDGMDACDEAVLDVLATMGLYQDGIMVPSVDGKDVTAHVFECTTQLSVTENQRLIRPMGDNPDSLPPVQMILCLKTKNMGKINSYRWCYNAFGRILNPEIVFNIDTGTYFGKNSLFRLWQAFVNDKDLGAACGAVQADTTGWWRTLGILNPLIATQNFEYKLAIQLERPMEASTGYLSVLPGAFSAYRFRAAMGRPLEQYFHGDPTLKELLGKKAPSDVYRLNRYLADDRILAFELVVKCGWQWHTSIVQSAVAYTDIPVSTTDFINQRRRWLNGAFFATIHSLLMVTRIWNSGHRIRIPFLLIQLLHNLLAFVLAWFSLSGYLLTTFIVNDITGDPPDGKADGFPFGRATSIVNSVIQIIYILTVVFQFVLALGSRPKGQVVSYLVSFAVFAIVQLYMLMNLVYLTKRLIDFKLNAEGGSSYAFINEYYSDVGDVTVLVTGASVFGVYIAAGVLSLDPWHLFTSWAQYMFVSSSYTNILNIYAFSNVHDVSWGEKSGKASIQRTGTFRDPNSLQVPMTQQEKGQRRGGGALASAGARDADFDLDAEFEDVVRRALTPHNRQKVTEEDDPKAKFMRFRTRLVAAYIFSNFLVCIIVLDQTFQGLYVLGDPYWHKIWFFRIWMWGNSALLLMKFAGMLWYRCKNMVMWIFERLGI